MPITNFSKTQNETYNLALGLARGDYQDQLDAINSGHENKFTKKDLEKNLRDRINNDILEGRTLYQAYRRNNYALCEVIEEIVNTVIGENIIDSPFIENFVEMKNRGLGDLTEFESEGGLLTVSSFAGNHWDTNRQLIDSGSKITLPREWAYIDVYEDLERFLLEITTLDKLVDKIFKSFNKYFKDRTYVLFQSVGNAVPAEFSKRGNSEEALGELCDLVQAAGGYDRLTIAGTKAALRKFVASIPDKTMPDSQKEAKNSVGAITEWEGNSILVIPQTLKSGTFDFALDKDKLFVFGSDVKPIKFEFFGDSRTKNIEDAQGNNDMSIEMKVQTLFGMGLVMPPVFGMFTWA